MKSALLTNVAAAQVPLPKMRALLQNLGALPSWAPEVVRVTPTATGFRIARTTNALNSQETIVVTTVDHRVTYTSTGGRLRYQLVFELVPVTPQQTTIQERLYLTDMVYLPVPVSLVAPVAKHAFAQNLSRLIALAEADRPV